MTHLFHIVFAIHLVLSLQLGEARAAGPYDGKWVGPATSNVGRCKPGSVALSVHGKDVTGDARFEVDAPKINGSVSKDGALGATIGWQPSPGSSARISSRERSRMETANGKCSWNARSSWRCLIDISLRLREPGTRTGTRLAQCSMLHDVRVDIAGSLPIEEVRASVAIRVTDGPQIPRIGPCHANVRTADARIP